MNAQESRVEDRIAIWNRVAESYDEKSYWSAPETHAWHQTLCRHIGNPAGLGILEMGCGSGFISLALARAGARVALLDIAPRALEKARTAFRLACLPDPPSYAADALNSGLGSESFDVVWNNGVIEHFSDAGKARLLTEMRRLTRPGGKTIVFVPNRNCWPFRIAQRYMKWAGTWPYGFEDDMSPAQLRRFCLRLKIRAFETYAIDPWLGWYWLPRFGPLLKRWVGPRPVAAHMRRTQVGWLSILAIPKESQDDCAKAA